MFTNSQYLQRCVTVNNGSSDGRKVHQDVKSGRITISGLDHEGKKFKRIVIIDDSQIIDNAFQVNGKIEHRIVYGRFESKVTKAGREVTRFHKNTGKGKHGKAISYTDLFGEPGVCHSWYKNGALRRQRFFYNNGRLAYDWRPNRTTTIKRKNGDVLFEVEGEVKNPANWQGIRTIFYGPAKVGTLAFEFGNFDVTHWFRDWTPFKVSRNGKVVFSGQYENHQRTGIWIINGVEHCYVHGVAIPRKLYGTPPEKLNPVKLLKIPNAQLRMAMLEKVGPARLAECGKVIHKDGTMRLFDIPGTDTRILRVQCPTTKSLYHLKVPKDSTNCEAARQWTFHVNGPGGIRLAPGIKQIQFTQET